MIIKAIMLMMMSYGFPIVQRRRRLALSEKIVPKKYIKEIASYGYLLPDFLVEKSA
jgi:hypothetical protein